ncbi:MAG TPA: DMT family transporter [Candidatus Brocadiia bacterium]|nr:DMT family transporter [Candidatus Brocadiia bacterium]
MGEGIGYLLAAVATLAWGLIVLPVKRAGTPGRLGIGISMLAGLAALAPLAPWWWPDAAGWRELFSWTGLSVLGAGICQAPLATIFYYEGARVGEVSIVAPLTRTKIVFAAALLSAFGLDTITRNVAWACAAGVAGAAVMTWRPGLKGQAQAPVKGAGLALLAALSWAAGDVLARRSVGRLPAMTVTFVSLALGAAAYYIYMAARGETRAIFAMPLRDKLLYGLHGLVSFGLAYAAFYGSMKPIGAAKAVVITAAWPGVSFVAGVAILGERITPAKAAGFVLLALSVALAAW